LNAQEYLVAGEPLPFPHAVDDGVAASWPEPEPFRVETEYVRDQAIVTPIGELDLATAGALHDLLIRSEAAEPGLLVCDLRRLSFMDCSGLRVLLETADRAGQADRQVKVFCAAGQVSRLLSLLNAGQQLDIARASSAARTAREERVTS
jgi:anti-anti-sigma factor